MEEILCEFVFSGLELFLSHVHVLENGDVKSELLAKQQVRVKEVDNLARVLPSPSTEDSGTIDSIGAHVVIKKWVEVQIGHAAHLSL